VGEASLSTAPNVRVLRYVFFFLNSFSFPPVSMQDVVLLTETMLNILGKICYLQVKALLSLVTELLVISRGTGESEESIINKQTALYSLKLLSRLLCKDYPGEFKEVRRFVVN